MKKTNYDILRENILSDSEAKKYYNQCTDDNYEIYNTITGEFVFSTYTQQELADKTGIDRADINRIINGKANPTIGTLKRIAKAMGMKLCISFEPLENKK